MDNKKIKDFFQNCKVNIVDNENLREPQLEGYKAVLNHFRASQEHAIIQIPVGCGKTGLMSILPFGLAEGRILIIAPNLEIKLGLSRALDINDKDCFWNKVGVLRDTDCFPYRTTLEKDANIHDCKNAHFVITNIHQLASSAERWLPNFEEDFFDMIIVDEAHHNAASSWQKVFEKFPRAKIISLTATPFRSDGKEVEGKLIYSYSYSSAISAGYIKKLRVTDAHPAEIWFEFKGDEYHHTLEEVLEMSDEAWFRRGVALSKPTNITIVDSSLEALERLRESGRFHQIIAAACTMDHARQIASLYEERNCKAEVILSDMPNDKRKEVLEKLRANQLDCIVQVGILGEGFDWAQLSVAAIFRPFKNLSPYIQFVGRIMRVLEQNDPYHPDNEGYIVSHIGLQQDKRWEDFNRFERDDREMFRKVVTGEDLGLNKIVSKKRRRIKPKMNVIEETLALLVTNDFLKKSDQEKIDDVLSYMKNALGISPKELGLTREELGGRLLQAQRREEQKVLKKRPVQPQEHRKQLRKRLREATKTVASNILNILDLSVGGYDLIRKTPNLSSGGNNLGATIILMNRQVNEEMGFSPDSRGKLDIESLELAITRLDEIGDIVERKIKKILKGEQ